MPKRRALYLQEGGEQCRVLGLRAGASLLVLLLAERCMASAELLAGLSDVALPSLRAIAHRTSAELSEAKQWHIPGYRCRCQQTLMSSHVQACHI